MLILHLLASRPANDNATAGRAEGSAPSHATPRTTTHNTEHASRASECEHANARAHIEVHS